MAKFYFTYGKEDIRFPYQNGWSEVEAPNELAARQAFLAIHPSPPFWDLHCETVLTEEQFQDTLMSFQANYHDRCHERITLTLERVTEGNE